MSYNRSNIGSGSRNVGRNTFDFGRTYVVKPRGIHQATIVWLHGIGEMGSSWSQFLESLPLPNVKWICPTAPTRSVSLFGGLHTTAWFNVEDLSDNATDDVEGLDASATHIANMLSNERDDIKLGVAGFSMGAAMALYCATCRALGQYGNGNRYPINLSVAMALSGWLPCSRIVRSRVHASQEATRRAASLHILLYHGQVDDVIEHKHGEKSAQTLHSAGFNVTFRTYNGLGHYTIPEEVSDMCCWLVTRMGINGYGP
ncbi:alpha/Beta hydrolase fold protein [Artemisia annua]|uniref:Alpha/Beta hydrolase fold protein n=1 Tax=Artemisia annua TaxID=35608 RepID=A0A2U1QGI0_ARTAN|nr:alpha/Beta hydrolase fold protein [Artemisia annua]